MKIALTISSLLALFAWQSGFAVQAGKYNTLSQCAAVQADEKPAEAEGEEKKPKKEGAAEPDCE